MAKENRHPQSALPSAPVAPAFTPAAAPVEAAAVPAVSPEVAAHREKTVAQAARMASVPKIAPRFGPGRQVAEPTEADPEYAKEGLLVLAGQARCGRQDCGGGIPIPADRGLLERTLDTLGWQKFRDKWFCSRMCVANETTSPSITLQPKRPAPASSLQPHTLVAVHGHVRCDRPDCGARVPVHGMTPAQMVAAAVASGFVQTPDGVFCSHEHAREVVRGTRAPIQPTT